MNQDKDQESHGNQANESGGVASTMDVGGVSPNPTTVDKDDEKLRKEILKWGAERYLENTRFFLDLGVKGVGIFYAVLGGILSIYFAKNTEKNGEVINFFLLVPLIISLFLGIVFFVGALAWGKAAKKLNEISAELKLGVIPTLFFITSLIYALGVLFMVTGIALWLLYRSFS